jgi:GNAT superfamily N-acetyltransferase
MQGEIVRLGAAELHEAIATLTDAFTGDPLMAYLFGEPRGIAALAGFACAYRLAMDWPVFGLRLPDGTLGGVASVSPPGGVPDREAFQASEDEFRQMVGPEAWNRYSAYDKTSSIGAPSERCHYLGMIGVLRSLRGAGCGRALIEAVHNFAAQDPSSAGVWLDTELPANVSWYERRGYRLRAVNRLGDIAVSVMFRPRGDVSA